MWYIWLLPLSFYSMRILSSSLLRLRNTFRNTTFPVSVHRASLVPYFQLIDHEASKKRLASIRVETETFVLSACTRRRSVLTGTCTSLTYLELTTFGREAVYEYRASV